MTFWKKSGRKGMKMKLGEKIAIFTTLTVLAGIGIMMLIAFLDLLQQIIISYGGSF